MPKQPPHNFHLRLPDDVMAHLVEGKGDNSLNKEIVDRLRGTMADDDVAAAGRAMRQILDKLDSADRRELLTIAVRALKILAKAKG